MYTSQFYRIKKYRDNIRHGLNKTCAICYRKRFENQVQEYTSKLKDTFLNQVDNIKDDNKKELYTRCIGGDDFLIPENLKSDDKFWLCTNCSIKLSKGTIPEMSNENSLQTFKFKNMEAAKILNSLSPLEMMLIARNYPFQLIFNAPVSGWKNTQGRLVNIPISTSIVNETIKQIPGPQHKNAFVTVELKKMKKLKKAYKTERIDKDKIHIALHILKELKNPHYIDIEDNVEKYFNEMQLSNPEGYSFFCRR